MANLAHRLFLDTNVLFSAAYSEDSDFQRLWQLPDTALIISPYILSEVLRHIVEPSRLERLGRLLAELEVIENWTHVILPDEMTTLRQKDIPVIQAAIAAQATHLITGDKHDFGDYFGQAIEGVEIIQPAEYLRRLHRTTKLKQRRKANMADTVITPEIIERYKNVAGATVYSAVRAFGYEPCFMRDVHAFTPGGMLVGRAKTLRFVPPRKDIIAETHRGAESPEYEAMGSCEPGDVLVIDGMGKKYAAIGGDVKLLQLKMQSAAGLVTDASIRDLDIVKDYGLKVFAGGRTPMGGADEIDPFEANVTIGCGGVAVRPGDLIVADDDGVVVVPECVVEQVIDWVEEHEWAEEHIKGMIEAEGVAPGKYYPPTEDVLKLYPGNEN